MCHLCSTSSLLCQGLVYFCYFPGLSAENCCSDALAQLADVIGREEGPMLKNRGDSLSKLIGEYLWDEESSICESTRGLSQPAIVRGLRLLTPRSTNM